MNTEINQEALFMGVEYGRRIRQARKAVHLNQLVFGKQLSKEVGRQIPFSQAAISDLENGKGSAWVTPSTLSRMLNKPEEYFAEGILNEQGLEYIKMREQLHSVDINLEFPNTGLNRKKVVLAEHKTGLVRPEQYVLSPVEKATMRRLEEFLSNPKIDRGIKFRLVNLISGHLDIMDELMGTK